MSTKLHPRQFFYHPLLIAVYPILALLANNLDQVPPSTALRGGLISLAGGAVIYLALRLVLRDSGRAALLATFCLVLFFSYGHVYQLVEGQSLAGFIYGKHRYLILFWLLVGGAGTWWIARVKHSAFELNRVMNVVALVLLVFPLYSIGMFQYRAIQLAQTKQAAQSAAPMEAAAADADSPDIYYIILDGYSRADVMQELYDLDITPFLKELESIGFVLPECAQSNYGITAFSMFASLNMDYLDAYGDTFPLGSDLSRVDYQFMQKYLSDNRVRQYLEARGYQSITFETGFWWLNIHDSDLYIVENNNPLKQYSSSYDLSNFEDLFIRTTALRVLSEANAAFLAPFTRRVKTPAEQHYEWVKFSLNQLDKIPEIPGKKFVYFHVLAPHDPFVFAPDGSFLHSKNDLSDMPGYPNEVEYLNKRVLEIVRNLIAQSDTPPIIIIQGDHGWDPRHRMEILNAYYLPNGGDERIYDTITPVNTFRVVLDHYFGENFGLLEDASYYSMASDIPAFGVRSTPYLLTPVPSTCMSPLN
jgi:hypothetical protein